MEPKKLSDKFSSVEEATRRLQTLTKQINQAVEQYNEYKAEMKMYDEQLKKMGYENLDDAEEACGDLAYSIQEKKEKFEKELKECEDDFEQFEEQAK
jgi:recombinational DNA repair ATPase RecF